VRQEDVTRIYDRNALCYDLMQGPMERLGARNWRPLLFRDLAGRVLELGVGTGKNLPHYPRDAEVTAIDPAPRMLDKARKQALKLGVTAELRQADSQRLPFPDNSFDAAVASFVFCSVADPVKGLKEALRVLKPGGELRLLEHQRPAQPLLARGFDLLNPLAVRVTGANINRRTDDNVRRVGFAGVRSEALDRLGIVRLITARKGGVADHASQSNQNLIEAGERMKTQTITLSIHDLGCGGGGALALERALAGVPGVNKVYVNPATETAYIDCEPNRIDPDRLISEVERLGYRAGQLERRPP
jgi:ubiquinone/menaquinone biosynthesis C-methylase UbiE/copper chaperone CopZ